ncbi:YbbR-like domain-containing protein [Virgibacillus sp. NKC19-16]|uniref:CdaR family protein n=1 Tax=Virgibacillus salidurans TaxID=2831673 RepID=UPI001EEBE8B2|nr:CdaR family protein [Virgibacillus sp. NKC19-16]UJL46615.1 YbbR-like domain-containing protein [Virgibacillus sp. NKC19-16]
MDKWFESKWFVRIIALVFAILLYVMVSMETDTAENENTLFPETSDEVSTLENVPVDIRMDEENYVVSGVPEYVNVTLEGVARILTPVERQRNFDVFVNLEGLGEGTHEVEIQYEDIPPELSVYIEPKTAEVTIEERATEEFPVTVDFINSDQLAEGFELGDFEVEPTSVSITSSRSIIDQIGMVKVFVNVSGLDQSINNREVPVNVYDSQGNELNVLVEPENAVVSADINNPSDTVSLNISTTGELPDGYALESLDANIDEVEIFATTDVLEEIESVSTEEIDLSQITESQTIDASLSLPEGAVSETETVEVDVEVEPAQTIEDVPIETEGLQDGQDVTFVDPDNSEMDITIAGNGADVSELTAGDFNLFIDVSDLEEGEHSLPVTIEGPDDVTITGEFEEVTIEIT